MLALPFVHVDVFSPGAYGGNSLAVFPAADGLDERQMLAITQELRHFESIFLIAGRDSRHWQARVFDLFEELPFAGHPLIGAAAALHRQCDSIDPETWSIALKDRTVSITTRPTPSGYFGLLDQGLAEILGAIEDRSSVAQAFALEQCDLDERLPLAVISTGLRYLIVPVKGDALSRASIATDITAQLRTFGAQFAVLLNEADLEVRHWNNDGIIEDVATGSAAGTIGVYRLLHGLAEDDQTFTLHQGRFTGRPSLLQVQPYRDVDGHVGAKVGGNVSFVATGQLEALP